jgi:peroxiredoxin
MKKRSRLLQIIVLLSAAILVIVTIVLNLSSKEPSVKEGSEAPSFNLLGMDGKMHTLSEYQNQTVIVNFWGTFCPPCKAEMPAIQRQYDKWKEQGLIVLGINLGESNITVKSFVDQYQLTFPILYDPNLSIRDKYRVTQYPTTFFIKNGKIITIRIGEMDEKYLNKTINDVMNSE